MNITVQTVYDWLNSLAPFDSAEGFDNVGLLLGDFTRPVSSILFGLDATPQLARQAADEGVQLVVTHHPLIFNPLKHISYSSPLGQAIVTLAAGGVSLISAHTNWDKAPGGVSDALAKVLGLQNPSRTDDYMRLGTLSAPLSASELQQLVEKRLNGSVRRYGDSCQPISKVAVAGGAYGEGAADALLAGAQAYVVGEIKHHELLDACQRGLVIYEAGHYATEAPGIGALYERFLSDAAAACWQVSARLYSIAPYAGATQEE